MSWIQKLVKKPKRNIIRKYPDNLWKNCPECNHIIFAQDLEDSLYVCPGCSYHFSFPVQSRIKNIFNSDNYTILFKNETLGLQDPLKFKAGQKKYTDQLAKAQNNTNEKDAAVAVRGLVDNIEIVACFMNFSFMGGSMGTAVGEIITKSLNVAIENSLPFVMFTESGGARMQEGVLSLMQMAKITVSINNLKNKGLPYIVVLNNPTTGGVTASFAMLGDIHIAEKGALIAFTGRRVIEQIIREKLPDNFQKSDFLYDKGMLDYIVERKNLRNIIHDTLDILVS